MINKYYKIIHNNNSTLFKFIFSLRYLFAIFTIFIAFFLLIPNFFDYKKRFIFLKIHVLQNYNFNIEKYEKIDFQALPTPRIKLKNVIINFDKTSSKLEAKNLIIYPKYSSIYNIKNFQSNKLILKNSVLISEISNLNNSFNNFLNQDRKLSIDNLNLKIINENEPMIELTKINFTNYGYKKNLIEGDIFKKRFKIVLKDLNKNFKIKLLNTGLSADISFDDNEKENFIRGIFKVKILNSNLKFNFDYDHKSLNIYNSYFRSKDLSFKNNSIIIFEPFFNINSKFNIEEINTNIFNLINLKLLESKNLIKKMNIQKEIIFETKKFEKNLIDNLYLKLDLTYGNLDYFKKLSISGNQFNCSGRINFLEEFPLLFFDCSIISPNKRKLIKSFSIKKKEINKNFELKAKGYLSVINRKINFKDISTDNNYNASKEDLVYFKEIFERTLLEENFIGIFNSKKIKEFILELY